MKKTILSAVWAMASTAMASDDAIFVTKHDSVNVANVITTPDEETPQKNNWGARLRETPFTLAMDIQTKYMWRGMEMMTEESAPVMFPTVGYTWKGLYAYAMGGYAFNGKYAEVDLGLSYTWRGLTIGFNDYYYPTVDSVNDGYSKGGDKCGHWLEACITYAPEKIPLWITASNFFYGPDKHTNEEGESKQAYSTYIELGTYYDFQKSHRVSAACGMACNKSCYNAYETGFSVCNIEAKYTYNLAFKNGWALPLSGAFIYNPHFDKAYFNFTMHLGF